MVIAIQRICLSVCLSLLWLVYFGVEVDGRQQQPSFLFNHGALTILRYITLLCICSGKKYVAGFESSRNELPPGYNRGSGALPVLWWKRLDSRCDQGLFEVLTRRTSATHRTYDDIW